MDTKFTPRDGFPVEVQALFAYDCLLFRGLLDEKSGDALARTAAGTLNSINTLFKCRTKVDGVERRYLADSISMSLERNPAVTPNQLVALDCGLLDEELESDILAVVRSRLAGKGVRTLAPGEPGYFERHVGDCSYHRGPQWPLFNYMAAKREIGNGKPERAFNLYIYPLVDDVLSKSVGGVPELYNSDGSDAIVPRYQTWSLASFIIACKEFERASKGQARLHGRETYIQEG
jgi:glycogen debranching enzyme